MSQQPHETIGYGRQSVSDDDIEAVVSALRSDRLSQGPLVEQFEQSLASTCRVRHVVACSSGTAALHIACLALGVGPGDVLWTSTLTFVASANCARYCGAAVDLVDIDPNTRNLDVGVLKSKLERAAKKGSLPRAVVVVHFAGLPAPLREIHALSQEYGFAIVEDASHALGARYQESEIGSCRYSDLTVFSFHPVKAITTGEGGAVTCNSDELALKCRQMREHGIERDPGRFVNAADGAWSYEQQALGLNYRMCEMQSALGISQLARLHRFTSIRNELANRYDTALADFPLELPPRLPDCDHAWHLYVVCLDEETAPVSRADLFAGLANDGINCQVHYIPIHRQPYYQQLGIDPALFPEAERYYRHCLSLPIYVDLNDAQWQRVVDTLSELLT